MQIHVMPSSVRNVSQSSITRARTPLTSLIFTPSGYLSKTCPQTCRMTGIRSGKSCTTQWSMSNLPHLVAGHGLPQPGLHAVVGGPHPLGVLDHLLAVLPIHEIGDVGGHLLPVHF